MSKEMKLKVYDIVRVIKKDSDAYNAVGRIIDIDEDWIYPYEIEFDEDYNDELFAEDELELIKLEFKKGLDSDKKPILILSEDNNIHIKWQEGAIGEVGVNGCQIEDVIDVLVERLQGFQNGKFRCRENALAITHLEEAQNWLYRRTMKRKEQGVEGKYESHE